ncbi:AAA domain-containing protein [Dactylosporangium matsuzakiense]|uniref:Helicase n=1 Tax=Dactylosporangium matsuzakiense TaxID=53360 RepID=A0A9W6KT15_9ACTN|nr:AAA domain-containing protein [Dactylosporangium matsuzakiense]UWZ43417.1 DNA2/NAM7 family helicase [Dactylosporangium matsuzakiense]GLL05870.1 helicase [Dactylosporangium matsuzakiense]
MTVIDDILADFGSAVGRGVVVDSPPGAGKSTLVVRAARTMAEAGERLMVVAQTNEQVDDLIDRLASTAPSVEIGRLSASTYNPAQRVIKHGSVTVSGAVSDVQTCAVVIGTAAKWATVTEGVWERAIVDEAYQMRSDMLLRVAGRFSRGLFVGDPGQLDPFSVVAVERWAGLSWDPMQSAVAVLLRHNPDLPLHRLPVSWRLPPSAADVVSAAFYPFTPFEAGTKPSDRSLEFSVRAIGGDQHIEATLETARRTGWALHELPARHTVRTDRDAVAAIADIVVNLLRRGPVAYSEHAPEGRAVTADRVAVGAAHRDQVAAIRQALADTVAADVTVDTANRLQGREYDVTVILHPLSGRRDASAFHLEAGRLCVLASRHRHACVVVARAGIAELLDTHPSAEPVHLNVPVRFPDGWEANQAMLAHLSTVDATG